jgi:hypothetical protein
MRPAGGGGICRSTDRRSRDICVVAPRAFSSAWREQIDDAIAADPSVARSLRAAVRDLQANRDVDWEFAHAVSQPWNHRRYDWYDAAAILEVRNLALTGHVGVGKIEVSAPPRRDREAAENQTILATVPGGYEIECAGGAGDSDGRFEWSGVLELGQDLDDGTRQVLQYQRAVSRSRSGTLIRKRRSGTFGAKAAWHDGPTSRRDSCCF